MIVNEVEYKGKPVLQIMETEEDRYPLMFGIAKAKKILECIPEIKEFCDKYKKEG